MIKIRECLKIKPVLWILMLLITVIAPLSVSAHSGRTDSSGGHRDNKNVSGLGSYHYHHGMGPHLHPNGVCPYSSSGSTTKSEGSGQTTKPSSSGTTKTNNDANSTPKETAESNKNESSNAAVVPRNNTTTGNPPSSNNTNATNSDKSSNTGFWVVLGLGVVGYIIYKNNKKK